MNAMIDLMDWETPLILDGSKTILVRCLNGMATSHLRDKFYCRETWGIRTDNGGMVYKADMGIYNGLVQWVPAKLMTSRDVRIVLQVKRVVYCRLHEFGVEELYKIGGLRCIGVTTCGSCDGLCDYSKPEKWWEYRWDSDRRSSAYTKGYLYEDNPEVVAIEFEAVIS